MKPIPLTEFKCRTRQYPYLQNDSQFIKSFEESSQISWVQGGIKVGSQYVNIFETYKTYVV